MTEPNLVLVVAGYDDESTASDDFTVLKSACKLDELKILTAEVVTRSQDGTEKVAQHEPGSAAGAIGWGAAFGLAFGLFSPLLLATTVVGAAVGAVCHEIAKHHEEKEIGKDVEQYLLPGTTAIMVLADDEYADRLDRVVARAARKVTRAVDAGDAKKLDRALTEAEGSIDKAVDA